MRKYDLKINPYPGFFLDIEGPDGCGGSTQVDSLKKWLSDRDVDVYKTKEPTDNIIGGLIRGALTGVFQLPTKALQLLFVADRLHHLDKVIIPVLNNGGNSLLICDRYLWSTVAFGGISLGRDWLLSLQEDCFLPDVTVFLKVSPEVCARRLGKDRFDLQLFETTNKLEKVWQNYLWLAKKFKKSIHVVDGEQSPQKVTQDIINLLSVHKKFQQLLKK